MAQDPVQLLSQAEKALSSAGSGFSFFGSKTEKYENAAELYIKAANAYRVKQEYEEAGRAYEKAATIQGSKLSEPDDMANTLQDAFKAYRGPCAKDAARCLSQAIDHYLSKGNFRRAATQEQLLAELYETSGERSKARSAYALAAQWFEDDNSPATANKLNLKAADLAALDSDYLDAIKRFEHVAKQSLSTNALRFSIKDYLLRAGICHLALDIVGAKRALDSYRELDPQFPSTSQFNLLANLTEQVEKGDSEMFEDVAYQYDRLNPMSEWFKIILGRVKQQIEAKEEDFS